MQAMNYTETIDYLFNSLPMFSRIGAFAYKEGMENTLALDKYFKHPHKKFKTIHVAGTNGKGSVSHLLAASLQKSGYKTGLYTSPHVKDFRERIRIDGQMITQEFIVQFVAENHSFFETLKPSFFEMTVLMAFEYFAQNQIDVAVVEVGLGGRLDSTNIIVPELSVITNISLDHVNLLGDSLAKIAFEKAGIIKKQIPVVIGESVDETRKIFENKAMEMDSPIFFAQEKHIIKKSTKKVQGKQIFESDFYGEISLGLLGIYQQKNLSTFLTCIDILNKKSFHISQTAVKAACESVIELTGLLGRWQVIQNNPTMICDIGHNEAGISYVVEQLEQLQYEKLHFVLGLVNDKDVNKILSLLPKNAIYYFTKASIPRALNEKELKCKAETYGLKGHSYSNVKEAVIAAKDNANANDIIFIGGSNFVVADALCCD